MKWKKDTEGMFWPDTDDPKVRRVAEEARDLVKAIFMLDTSPDTRMTAFLMRTAMLQAAVTLMMELGHTEEQLVSVLAQALKAVDLIRVSSPSPSSH